MKKHYSVLLAALLATSAYAGKPADNKPAPLPDPVMSATKCSKDTFTITHAGITGGPQVQLSNAQEASSCIGVYETPNNLGAFDVSAPNLGYAGNGLLNGEVDKNGNAIVSGTQFITESQLQDLNPATTGKVDPGWIQLGKLEHANSGDMSAYSITRPNGQEFDLGKVVKYTQTVTNSVDGGGKLGGVEGVWTLTVDKDAVDTFTKAGLFERSSFDHLAFELKAGSNWAVYDFDFTKIAGFDLTKPYTISGTFNLNDFRNPENNADQGISGLSVWARDPILPPNTTVPEPGMLALFGAGMLSMAALRRRRQAR